MTPHIRMLSVLSLLVLFSPARAADLHRYLPGDAKFVILVRARLLLDSPLVDRDRPFTLKGILKEDFKDPEILAVKPLDDIATALVALPSVGEVSRVFVVLEGKFDPAAIRARVARLFKDTVKEHGKGALAFQEFRIEQKKFQGVTTPAEVFLAVPERNVCLISLGSKDDLATALAEKAKGTPAPLRELIEKSDKDQVVSYALLNDLRGPLAERKELKKAFALFQTVHGGGRIDEDVLGNVVVTAANADACRNATEILRNGINTITGAVALLSSANKDFKPILDIMRTVRLGSKDAQITIRGKLERDVLEEMLKKRQEAQTGK